MRVALIMCPMRYRAATTGFEALHNMSKGEPQFVRFFNGMRRKGLIDFRSYPLGPICLATAVKARHEARVFNFLDGTSSLSDLIAFKPDVAAFTCSTGSALLWVAETAELVKRECGAVIVLGGPHVTLDPAKSLTTTVADFCVAGEGDLVFPELLDHIEGKAGLPRTGVWCRRDGAVRGAEPAVVEDLALLPVPDHSLVDQSRYCGVHIETSRGCGFCCEFCFLSGMPLNRRYRPRPVEAVVAELAQVAKLRDLSRSKVYIVDSNFRFNDRILELMAALKAADIKTDFWTATDIRLDPRALAAMAERGFFFLHSGIEDGSLGRFPKIRDEEELFSFVKRVHGNGLIFGADLILGYPGQKPADLKKAVTLAKQLCRLTRMGRRGPTITFQPHFFRPYPNTPVVNELVRGGWKEPESFRAWGRLHDDISRGTLSAAQRFHSLSRSDLIKAMLSFIMINMRYLLIPWGAVKLRLLVLKGGKR